MKEKLTILATVALLALSLGMAGCMTTDNHKTMDNSMSNQTQTMEKNSVHHESMTGTMENKKNEEMKNTMAVPMENNMEKGGMQSDMSGSMK